MLPAMLYLHELPDDLLSHITYYLNGRDITSLYETLNKELCQTLEVAVKGLDLVQAPSVLSKLPLLCRLTYTPLLDLKSAWGSYLAPRFKHLRVLKVYTPHVPIHVETHVGMLTNLPPSLIELYLDFHGSIYWFAQNLPKQNKFNANVNWFLSDPWVPIATLFPKLELLHIENRFLIAAMPLDKISHSEAIYQQLELQFITILPTSLISYYNAVFPTHSEVAMGALPPKLTRLGLDASVDHLDPAWASALRSRLPLLTQLVYSGIVTVAEVAQLPDSLLYLHVNRLENNVYSVLPPSLRRLSLDFESIQLPQIEFPETLETLEFKTSFSLDQTLANCPVGLKKLKVLGYPSSFLGLQRLSKLSKLCMPEVVDNISNLIMSLPNNLTHLNISCAKFFDDVMHGLPSTLTFLDCKWFEITGAILTDQTHINYAILNRVVHAWIAEKIPGLSNQKFQTATRLVRVPPTVCAVDVFSVGLRMQHVPNLAYFNGQFNLTTALADGIPKSIRVIDTTAGMLATQLELLPQDLQAIQSATITLTLMDYKEAVARAEGAYEFKFPQDVIKVAMERLPNTNFRYITWDLKQLNRFVNEVPTVVKLTVHARFPLSGQLHPFPTSITDLTLSGKLHPSNNLLNLLPPNLTSLTCFGKSFKTLLKRFSSPSLPPSFTKLSLHSITLMDDDLPRVLPIQITELRLSGQFRLYSSVFASRLPRALQKLYLTSNPWETRKGELLHFPKSLEYISFAKESEYSPEQMIADIHERRESLQLEFYN